MSKVKKGKTRINCQGHCVNWQISKLKPGSGFVAVAFSAFLDALPTK